MKRKLRIVFVWTLVSLVLQFGAYALLNNEVSKVMEQPAASEPITRQLKATIPGTDLNNIQISYAKDYLAYTENGVLKVFNLKKEKVVFEKKPPTGNDKTLGVLTYQWLPDRNTLLYFYAKKNPNPVTTVIVQPPKVTTPTSQSQTPSQTQSQNSAPSSTTSPTLPKTEDPNQAGKVEKEVPKTVSPNETPTEPKVEKRYGNPQLTELYSLELPDSDEETAPDDRFNRTIDSFPAGGKIEEMVVSTFTNLMYLTVKNGTTEQLIEIDVMKNVRTLSRAGELIDNMAASDRHGTLYLDSKVGGVQQVVALDGGKRHVISKNANDMILGIRNGKVYLGEVKNNQLVKIKTTDDPAEIKDTPSLKTEWTGSIPFKNVRTQIGAKGQVIVNDHQTAYIITDGQLHEVKLQGDENYVSVDGVELVRLTREGTSTLAELQPLK